MTVFYALRHVVRVVRQEVVKDAAIVDEKHCTAVREHRVGNVTNVEVSVVVYVRNDGSFHVVRLSVEVVGDVEVHPCDGLAFRRKHIHLLCLTVEVHIFVLNRGKTHRVE